MTRSTTLPSVCLVLAALGFSSPTSAAPPDAALRHRTANPLRTGMGPPSRTPGEIVVIADGAALEISGGVPRSRNTNVAAVLREHGLVRARAHDRERAGSPRHARAWTLSSERPAFDPVAAANALRATGAVVAASPNYRFGLHFLPDDLYLVYQWYVDDLSFADIRLPFAWDVERGDSAVTIAILDTGVDAGHPDLAAKMWTNPDEIAANGIDDDGNGFIDDVKGWDFGVGDNDPAPQATMDSTGIDVGFHGTFCAGIAAAGTNNGEGIAGASWESRILPLKISEPDGGITTEAIGGAFLYALDEGASIISMSFGAHADTGAAAGEVPAFFESLVDLATAQGTLCVASAGNESDSISVYPAATDDVLSVAATDFNNERASFSNWGPWVDIAAPGSLMWSTIARNYTVNAVNQLLYILAFGWDGVNPYMYGDGTSFAAPLVAGVAGLVRARYPSLTPAQIRQHLVSTGDVIAYDLAIGPKVNASTAVSSVPTAVEIEATSPSARRLRVTPNPFRGAGRIRFDLPAPGEASVAIYDVTGRLVRTLAEGTRSSGPHTIDWDGRDDRGTPLGAGIYFVRLAAGPDVRKAKVVVIGP
ncbi:MAG TPA: S8 family serine peptidase [Candidatus Eisenbacteria bacterium]|nr:S8 family serine peptidase [Candidatus Eisenbacteria bacterium]